MSLITDIMSAASLPMLLDTHGESATYTPVGGSPRAITVAYEILDTGEEIDNSVRRQLVTQVEVTALNDATTGIDNPQLSDKITIDSVDYWLAKVTSQNAACVMAVFGRRRTTETSTMAGRQRTHAG